MPLSADDVPPMRRAIRLAMSGRGRVEPNPMVGCVIVKAGRTIGEGYHEQFGGPHAEPSALAACTESPAGATAYVTLEPCCHTAKQTPPCAPRLIEAGIARVVIGAVDPNPAVNGLGIAALREDGVEVNGPALGAECQQLIAPFLARVNLRRPYVTLKWAQTADGKVAGPGGARLRISNAASARLVHELRARCDAILVGVNTVIKDDPTLTARGVDHARPLTRVVLDRALAIPVTSTLVATATPAAPLVVYCHAGAMAADPGKVATLEGFGVAVIGLDQLSRDHLPVAEILADLHNRGVTHLLVEPGPTLATALIADDWADRVWVFRSPTALDDPHAPAAPLIPSSHATPTGTLALDGDTLTEYLNPRSPAFFAPVPSADLVLATP